MTSLLALISLQLSWAAPALDLAPEKLFTQQGLEIRLDDRVFCLFFALNMLGYSRETRMGAPPISAPQFHPVRTKLRAKRMALTERPVFKRLRTLFEANALSTGVYLRGLWEPPGVPRQHIQATQAANTMLASLAKEPLYVETHRALSEDRRLQAKALWRALERDLAALQQILKKPVLPQPAKFAVVPNPLDAFGAFFRLEHPGQQVLVVGPALADGRRRILKVIAQSAVRQAVRNSWQAVPELEQAWGVAQKRPAIRRNFKSGLRFLEESLAQTLALATLQARGAKRLHRAGPQTATEPSLWVPALLQALSRRDKSQPLDRQLSRLLRQAF